MKNIAFIINPIAGTVNKKKLPKQISALLDKDQWLENIVFTEYPGHATELARQFAQMSFDAVVAVGGDAMVNEVAAGLRDTETALGVLPMGEHNYFARHIGVSTRLARAMEIINRSEPIRVDYAMSDGQVFVTYITLPTATRIVTEGVDQAVEGVLIANAKPEENFAAVVGKISIQDGKLDVASFVHRSFIVRSKHTICVHTPEGEKHIQIIANGLHVLAEKRF